MKQSTINDEGIRFLVDWSKVAIFAALIGNLLRILLNAFSYELKALFI